jgi:8-oxo-dGTP pyrophosphatase MutT (NUDIX family)
VAGVVRAAGGVVWRLGSDGLEVLVVHRPRYDDWSFPKGKLDPTDHDDESCAIREVREETGLEVAVGPELPGVNYTDNQGRAKAVRYWAMTPVDGGFVPNAEVDAAEWLAPDLAARRLSYGHDRRVLDAMLTAIDS